MIVGMGLLWVVVWRVLPLVRVFVMILISGIIVVLWAGLVVGFSVLIFVVVFLRLAAVRVLAVPVVVHLLSLLLILAVVPVVLPVVRVLSLLLILAVVPVVLPVVRVMSLLLVRVVVVRLVVRVLRVLVLWRL